MPTTKDSQRLAGEIVLGIKAGANKDKFERVIVAALETMRGSTERATRAQPDPRYTEALAFVQARGFDTLADYFTACEPLRVAAKGSDA